MTQREGQLFPTEQSAMMRQKLCEGAVILRGFVAGDIVDLISAVNEVAAAAPFRRMITPGGREMSVAMTNCGELGWITDTRGYRYQQSDPVTGNPWPAMPALFRNVASRAASQAGFMGFEPNACLINSYAPGSRLSLHQDKDEGDFRHPIVSVSLGVPATFLFGGTFRSERPRRIRMESGDVAVWGGPARLNYHGVAPIPAGVDSLLGDRRINLTFRTVV